MSEYKNPPYNSLIATLFINGMSSEEEVGETSPSAEPVGSADIRGLETDEESSTVSLVPYPHVVAN